MKDEEKESYLEAAEEWKTKKLLPKKERRCAQKIVDDINKKNNTNVNESTVRRRVKQGIETVSPC